MDRMTQILKGLEPDDAAYLSNHLTEQWYSRVNNLQKLIRTNDFLHAKFLEEQFFPGSVDPQYLKALGDVQDRLTPPTEGEPS